MTVSLCLYVGQTCLPSSDPDPNPKSLYLLTRRWLHAPMPCGRETAKVKKPESSMEAGPAPVGPSLALVGGSWSQS